MIRARRIVFALFVVAALAISAAARTTVTKKSEGTLPNGATVDRYTLKDEKLQVQVITYGGFVVSVKTPDRAGKLDDVVLGFDDAAGYYENNHSDKSSSFGPIIGRYANRIAHATFTLDGNTYHLPKNNGDNSLHGGPNGFSDQMWEGKEIKDGIELHYVSKDGEAGYPGNLSVTVRYTLRGGELRIEYSATTDK